MMSLMIDLKLSGDVWGAGSATSLESLKLPANQFIEGGALVNRGRCEFHFIYETRAGLRSRRRTDGGVFELLIRFRAKNEVGFNFGPLLKLVPQK